jgi:hypothetical protein
MSIRLRCSRGHFLPASARPVGDPHDWDDTCRCVITRRPRRRHRFTDSGRGDLWGQGLSRRRKYRIATVSLTGSYL